MMPLPTTDFSGNHTNFEEGAMATSIGLVACVSPIISLIFKLLNVISDQLMDCSVTKDHCTHIAVHKLDKFMFKSLNLAKIVKFTYYCPHNCQNLAKILV